MANNINVVHYARIMRVDVRNIVFIILILLAPTMILAQDRVNPPPPDVTVMSDNPPPPGLPIDFGISALIAAGLALGIHHIKNRK